MLCARSWWRTVTRRAARLQQSDGDFVSSALKEAYKFKESGDELLMFKDDQYLALIVHPKPSIPWKCRKSPDCSACS
jgi:hypothetical protein